MFLRTKLMPILPVAEAARLDAEDELFRLGYLERPWGVARVGFGHCSRRLDIRRLYVEPPLRTQGIGTALVDAIKAYATDHDWSVCALSVTPCAVNWWWGQGFSPPKTTSGFNDWVWTP